MNEVFSVAQSASAECLNPTSASNLPAIQRVSLAARKARCLPGVSESAAALERAASCRLVEPAEHSALAYGDSQAPGTLGKSV